MIKWEDIQKANASIRTTDIKGKLYAEVNQRIKAFRMVYPEGVISTELVSDENGVCIMKATVGFHAEDGMFIKLGNGTAYEKEGSTFINKTSYIENCETSAVGRALGMAGFGIDTSVASAEEVQNAILNQNNQEEKEMVEQTLSSTIDTTKWKILKALANKKGIDYTTILEYYGVEGGGMLTVGQWKEACDRLYKMKDK